MKLRYSLVFAFVALLSSGCAGRYWMLKEPYAGVKKVALVQYAINPHALLGTANAEEARVGTAEAAWDVFGKEMAASYQLVPLAEMSSNPAYAAAGPTTFERFYTGKGAQFFSPDLDNLLNATIPPDTAKKLCEGLAVDAVAVVYETWGVEPYALGFKGKSANTYVINMYDKTGTRVWGDWVRGVSEEGFATPAGVVSTEVANYVLNNKQAFTAALKDAQQHIATRPPSTPGQ